MSIPITSVQALLDQVRQDREELIEFRRGDLTLNAQPVRIEKSGLSQAREQDSQAASQIEAYAVVLGAVDLDIQVGDRFNDASDTLYEVVYVSPNRQVCTQAQVRVIQ